MPPLDWRYELSFRRVPLRALVMVHLCAVKETNTTALAKAVNVDASRLRKIMHGYAEEYSVELSPIVLGLAEELRVGPRVVYRVTPLGVQVAEMLLERREIQGLLQQASWAGAFVWPGVG